MKKQIAFILLTLSVIVIIPACSQRELSTEEKKELDSLDTASTVKAYFSSGDPATEFYLSSNKWRERLNRNNFIQENERVGGIDNLSVKIGKEFFDEKRQQYIVQYTSRSRASTGVPPGSRYYFVYVIQETKTKLWKIDGIGTGP